MSIGSPLLRLRSDDQLVALFREGNDEAFRVIHDRYRQRLFAYTRQMLPSSRQDAEDALQDVFVRAYSGLRANDRELALRAWLYRVAHNRCIDVLRRPMLTPTADELPGRESSDPVAIAEQREALASLIADVQRLPEQQRSALLMRELSGMSYNDLAAAMGLSVPAVKSLLVRARVGLAQALEARDAACVEIRRELVDCHDRGVRATGTARRHLRDCEQCCQFRRDIRGISRQFAAVVPAVGPLALIAKLLGIGGGAGGSSAGAGGGAAAAGGGAAVTGGAVATAGGGAAVAGGGATISAGHIATLVAAAIVTAGGAVALHPAGGQTASHAAHHHLLAARRSSRSSSALVRADNGDANSLMSAAATSASAGGPSFLADARQSPAATGGASMIPQGSKAARHQVSSVSTGMAATTTLSAWGGTSSKASQISAGASGGSSSTTGCPTPGTTVTAAKMTGASAAVGSAPAGTTGSAAGTAPASGSGSEAGSTGSGTTTDSGSRASSCAGSATTPTGSAGSSTPSTSGTAATGTAATTSGDGSASTAGTPGTTGSTGAGSTGAGVGPSSGAASTPAG